MQTSSNNLPDNKGEKLISGIGSLMAYTRLAKVLIFSAVWALVALFFWYNGIPYYIVLPIMVIPVIFIVLEVMAMIRFKRMDTIPAQTMPRVLADPQEKTVGTIAGIMRMNHRGGYAVLGTGRVRASENALIVTDKNIYAVTVPLAGAGKIVGGNDISLWQWMLAGKKIREKLEVLLAGGAMQSALDAMAVNQKIIRADISSVTFDDVTHSLTVATRTGVTLQYSTLINDEYLKAKTLLNT